ncbi:MAG: hypothetical protein ACP5HM_07960 [Anaerolineae bacterium]
MKRTGIVIVLLVAGLAFGLGLLFLCAAIEEPRRLPLSLILLAGGGGAAFWSGRQLRRLHDLAPERLAERIIAMARAHSGEVTLPQVMADLDAPREAAQRALERLQQQGTCHRDVQGAREVYVFPELTPLKVERRCPYCGARFSVKTPIYTCPHCGGSIEVEKV